VTDASGNGPGPDPVIRPTDITPPPVEGGSPEAPTGADAARIDRSRVRSFLGISIGLVGPRANLAVSGVLITLYVQQRASSALAVTFALTADRLFSWLTYPISGRISDRTRSRVGRRTPYMAGSLIVMGVSTWMFTVVQGYWLLVLMIVIAGQAAAVFTLTNVAVVPEVFGRSRWIKALVLTTVLGTVASLAIKATVITSWKQSDPSTWNLPFQVAAVIMVVVGIVVLVLVREAPAASAGAAADRGERAKPARQELRKMLEGPNAKVLVAGSLLFWSGVGSTAYVAILFFQRVLHAGASAQTIAGLATGLPVFFLGIGLGIPLSRVLSPRQLAIGAPFIGACLAGVQYFDTHLWQAVVLSYIGAPFIGAYIIVLAPMLLQLLPRSGGLGERLGTLLSPFNLVGVAVAYLAAYVVDATGNYRLIWLFPAATGLAHATVNCWLKFPPKRSSSPDMIKRLWEWSIVQAESMSETGIVTGLLAAPLLGVVTDEDADSAVVMDMARNILGNPYEDDSSDAPEDGSGPDDGSRRGVTGVTQVGGGPAGDERWGDQKLAPEVPVRLGMGGTMGVDDADPGSDGSSGSSADAEATSSDPTSSTGSTTGTRSVSGPSDGSPGGLDQAAVPDGGVTSIGSIDGTGAGVASVDGRAAATGDRWSSSAGPASDSSDDESDGVASGPAPVDDPEASGGPDSTT
jgi:Na+/melibiose symporter-like transporter